EKAIPKAIAYLYFLCTQPPILADVLLLALEFGIHAPMFMNQLAISLFTIFMVLHLTYFLT
ncbi:hypothetical protein, partial [Nostoc sp.]